MSSVAKKLYLHCNEAQGGATLRLVVPRIEESVDYKKEAQALVDLLERFLPRETFEAVLELFA
jgi:hypothetical protein